jgi:hypothetical protein
MACLWVRNTSATTRGIERKAKMVAANEFQTITPQLFFWQEYDPRVKCDLSSVALWTEDGLVFVDPIPLCEGALEELTHERTPTAIVLTSANHERAADQYRRRFGIPVCASAEAAPAMDIPVDRTLQEGEMAPGRMQVVALSSAGKGEIALVGHGTACLGDAVVHLVSHGFSLLPDKYCIDSGRLPNDLRKLLSYDFHILTFAHGDPLVDDARERLQQLLA